MAPRHQQDQRAAARPRDGVGVLVRQPALGGGRADRHAVEHLWLAAAADLGVPPARDWLSMGVCVWMGKG